MANYNRTIISSVWTSLDFRKMTDKEKVDVITCSSYIKASKIKETISTLLNI